MADGTLRTCALKRIIYDSDPVRAIVNAELASLRDVYGGDYNARCIGVFDDWCPVERMEYLWIAME